MSRRPLLPAAQLTATVALLCTALLPACSSQKQTGQALTVAGAAGVATGAILASDRCEPRGVPGERYHLSANCREAAGDAKVAGAALIIAGAGTALAGTALQHSGGGDQANQFASPADPPDPELRTAEAYSAEGAAHAARGEYASALDMYERALRIEERVLGRTHPQTQRTLSDVAHLCATEPDPPVCHEI